MLDFNLTNLAGSKTSAQEIPVKVLILGAGPAGFAAALYAARADLAPVVLTGMELGGQVAITNTVENYPGFVDGISGPQLAETFQKQAERFGAKFEFDSATRVDLQQRPYRVESYNAVYLAETLIITTGATSTHLNIPGETELTGRGVSYCATCDGWFFKGKDVVVVGGGDSALEEGLFLTRYANTVRIIHRRDAFRAGAILVNRARNHPKIEFVLNSVITQAIGQDKLEAVGVKDLVTGEEKTLPVDGLFIFIGHTPNTQLFNGQLAMDEHGYLITDKQMHTSIPGVFAGGEAADPVFRQVITSAGMGAAAAIEANRFLDEVTIHAS
jgi:thioredoxin reductase (NADPH)